MGYGDTAAAERTDAGAGAGAVAWIVGAFQTITERIDGATDRGRGRDALNQPGETELRRRRTLMRRLAGLRSTACCTRSPHPPHPRFSPAWQAGDDTSRTPPLRTPFFCKILKSGVGSACEDFGSPYRSAPTDGEEDRSEGTASPRLVKKVSRDKRRWRREAYQKTA